MCIQKILHQRLIFPIINGIAVTNFHAAAYLGEKDKSVLILLQFIFRNNCIRLFRIQYHIQRFTKSTEEIIKVFPLLIVSKKHFNFFSIAWIFQICKQFRQPGIYFPQASHRQHNIHHNTFQISAVKVLQPGAAVQIHSCIQLFNQSTIVHNQAVILALIQTVGTSNSLKQSVFFQLFVYVEHLADGGIKTGKQLTAHDKNINVPCAELILHCLFIGICVTVAIHHFIPVGNDLIVSTFIYIVYAFPEIRR
ncbi:unknown [Clostridium sp. CAG:242]|nr:unknown [Clostridium sp. CAG:242]